jgi:glycosyltransferase involved in cell wall biosynthesis
MIEAGFAPARLISIPSPAPVQRERPEPPPVADPPRFACVGRIVPAKGVRWLLEAMLLSKEAYHVDVVGEGYELDSLKRFAQVSGLADRVVFHGWLGADGVEAVIRSSRAVVFPSLWHEPAGLVTLEAAASGRAVVASRVGGIPEYALPEFALLAEPNDATGLARHLDTLARDHERATRMGIEGWTLSQSHFSMTAFLDSIEGLYRMS